MNTRLSGLQGDGLPVARQVIGPLALDLDRRIGRGGLGMRAGEAGQGRLDLLLGRALVGGGGDRAFGIVAVARLAPAGGEAVDLLGIHGVRNGLGRLAQRHGQDAGRHRIEGAGVSGLLRIEDALDAATAWVEVTPCGLSSTTQP